MTFFFSFLLQLNDPGPDAALLKSILLSWGKTESEIASPTWSSGKIYFDSNGYVTDLYLWDTNELTGEIPASLGQLSKLKWLSLHGNSGLSGHLPVLPEGCSVIIRATNISSVSVRTKALRPDNCFLDYFLVVMYIILGYADLVTDILAIMELFAVNRIAVGILNISFLVLNIVLGLLACSTFVDVIVTMCQLGPLVNGIETLMQGRQTQNFMADKKLDTIARSGPSTTLQLFTLLTTLSVISERGYFILLASITLGIVGAACTQASLARKSGRHMFRWRFFVHAVYYFSEMLLRIMTVCIMFIAIKGYAFILIAADLCFRLFIVSLREKRIDFTLGILYFGSDNALNADYMWVIGSVMTALDLFVFLIVINTLHIVELDVMREHDSVRDISIISCCALLVKTMLWMIIENLPEEPPEELKGHEEGQVCVFFNM